MTPAHWSALGILALSVGFSAYGARCQRRAAEDRAAAEVSREVARRLWAAAAECKRINEGRARG